LNIAMSERLILWFTPPPGSHGVFLKRPETGRCLPGVKNVHTGRGRGEPAGKRGNTAHPAQNVQGASLAAKHSTGRAPDNTNDTSRSGTSALPQDPFKTHAVIQGAVNGFDGEPPRDHQGLPCPELAHRGKQGGRPKRENGRVVEGVVLEKGHLGHPSGIDAIGRKRRFDNG
jgi:hypothetical protein